MKTMTRSFAMLACGLSVWLSGGFVRAQQPRPGGASYTLVPSPFGQQLKTPDGRLVFEYLTKKPDNSPLTSPSAACFHPVNTPLGEVVTALAPSDHSPHKPVRAMNITKADFWGWGAFATREGRVVQTQDVKLVKTDAAHAELEIHDDWPSCMTETRPRLCSKGYRLNSAGNEMSLTTWRLV